MFCKIRNEVVTLIPANLVVAGALAISSGHAVAADYMIMETFPDAVQASIEIHQKQIAVAAQGVTSLPNYLIVPTLNRWEPGSTVRVAFRGGSNELRSKIEAAANEWTKPGIANIKFQFRQQNGSFLEWSETDQQYKAEIRVAFNSGDGIGGFWSHVGRNSINGDLVGGRPNENSLNLDSFDKSLPADWKTVVIHEFGHALGFQHEHQNPVGGCDFRFEDDAGYVATKNAEGWYIPDGNGRRPGLYTFLGGYKNFWPKAKVDNNLRALQISSAYLVGQFDKLSVMKYVFSAFMFVGGENSPCYTSSENPTLSAQDKEGAKKAYPSESAAIASVASEQKKLLNEILASPQISAPFQANVRSRLEVLK